MIFNKRNFSYTCQILCAVVILAAGTGCTSRSEDLTRYIPKDVNVVAALDFQQLVRYKYYPKVETVFQKYFNRVRKSGKAEKLITSIENLELIPEKHLDKILFFSNVDPFPTDQRNANFPGIVIKTFGRSSSVLKFFQKIYGERSTDTGKPGEEGIISYHFSTGDSERELGAAVVDEDILVVARLDMLKEILEVYSNKKPGIAANEKLMTSMQQWKDNRFLQLAMLPEVFIPRGLRIGAMGVKIPKIFSLSFTIGEQRTMIRVNSPDEEGNQRFVNFFNGAKTILGAVQTENDIEKIVVALYKNAQAAANPGSIDIVYRTSEIIEFLTEILVRLSSDKILKAPKLE
jgi:hypothetical protein